MSRQSIPTVSPEKDRLIRQILASGRFIVTREGRVFDCKPRYSSSSHEPRELRYRVFRSDQVMVNLPTGGKPRQITVCLSRVVALSFLPDPGVLLGVVHLDGDKKNNRLSNLAWMDMFEAMQHASANGALRIYKGSSHKNAKLTEAQAIEAKRLLASGLKPTAIARQIGTTRGIVKNIQRGESWRHLP